MTQASKDATLDAKGCVERELSVAKEAFQTQAWEMQKARDAALAAELEVSIWKIPSDELELISSILRCISFLASSPQ